MVYGEAMILDHNWSPVGLFTNAEVKILASCAMNIFTVADENGRERGRGPVQDQAGALIDDAADDESCSEVVVTRLDHLAVFRREAQVKKASSLTRPAHAKGMQLDSMNKGQVSRSLRALYAARI